MNRLLIEPIDCRSVGVSRGPGAGLTRLIGRRSCTLIGSLVYYKHSAFTFSPHYTLHIPAAIGYASIFTIGTRLAMRKYMYITMCVIYDNLEAHEHRYNKGNARLG